MGLICQSIKFMFYLIMGSYPRPIANHLFFQLIMGHMRDQNSKLSKEVEELKEKLKKKVRGRPIDKHIQDTIGENNLEC